MFMCFSKMAGWLEPAILEMQSSIPEGCTDECMHLSAHGAAVFTGHREERVAVIP